MALELLQKGDHPTGMKPILLVDLDTLMLLLAVLLELLQRLM